MHISEIWVLLHWFVHLSLCQKHIAQTIIVASVISFEIRKCDTFNFVLPFKESLVYYQTLAISYEF